ncbi:MAG TPA: AMP-binding protein [Candidatus Acidoferrales bacterium]
MTFLETIFERLQRAESRTVVSEIHDGQLRPVTGAQLLVMVQQARQFLRARGLKKGDRCALLASNSVRWIALDLALLAEGVVVVPLYSRQTPAELIHMLRDSMPLRVFCTNAAVAAELKKLWPSAPNISLLDSIFVDEPTAATPPLKHDDADIVTIIYTSGTSGEAKGVMLNAANVTFMLSCTNARLDELMGARTEPDRIFHYLPFSFAASWIAMLSFLSRESTLTLSSDLTKLAEEMKLASPNYFLNVPTLLERVRKKIEETIAARGALASTVFSKARNAYGRGNSSQIQFGDSFWLGVANRFMFPTIRTGIGANLKALICGSAPLALETQQFFTMLGIPVLQVYGLTETTAICTMDDPHRAVAGSVGVAIPGSEMQIAENGEILVRGPHIFPGYWKREKATAEVLEGGWFHTGDQGEVDATGNWRITGRLKNMIVLNSGHKVPPEPLETALLQALPSAEQAVLIGEQRSFLSALVAMNSPEGAGDAAAQSAIDLVNKELPHYKQVRAFRIVPEPFSADNGMLTSNGKLKRDAIAQRYAAEIEEMYAKKAE